jgi:hypothetical protein
MTAAQGSPKQERAVSPVLSATGLFTLAESISKAGQPCPTIAIDAQVAPASGIARRLRPRAALPSTVAPPARR